MTRSESGIAGSNCLYLLKEFFHLVTICVKSTKNLRKSGNTRLPCGLPCVVTRLIWIDWMPIRGRLSAIAATAFSMLLAWGGGWLAR